MRDADRKNNGLNVFFRIISQGGLPHKTSKIDPKIKYKPFR